MNPERHEKIEIIISKMKKGVQAKRLCLEYGITESVFSKWKKRMKQHDPMLNKTIWSYFKGKERREKDKPFILEDVYLNKCPSCGVYFTHQNSVLSLCWYCDDEYKRTGKPKIFTINNKRVKAVRSIYKEIGN